jgi:hypothetical protein
MTQQNPSPEEVQLARYVGVRTMDMGLRLGFLEKVAKHPQGITTDDLARQVGMDPFYIQVWCRSAYASDILEIGENQGYMLAPYIDKLLLYQDFPGYMSGLPGIMVQPEIFDQFADKLPSGERIWWDQCSPTWIQMVSSTARPFYTCLIPGSLSQAPGLSDRLAQGMRVLDMACGGVGLIRTVQTYPQTTVVGLGGDAYTLELTADRPRQTGLQDRVSLVQSTLEDISTSEEFDLIPVHAVTYGQR